MNFEFSRSPAMLALALLLSSFFHTLFITYLRKVYVNDMLTSTLNVAVVSTK